MTYATLSWCCWSACKTGSGKTFPSLLLLLGNSYWLPEPIQQALPLLRQQSKGYWEWKSILGKKKSQSHCVHVKPFTCTRARPLFNGRMTHKGAGETTGHSPGPGWSWEIAICQLCVRDHLARSAATLLYCHTAGTGWQHVSFRIQITAVNRHCSLLLNAGHQQWTGFKNTGIIMTVSLVVMHPQTLVWPNDLLGQLAAVTVNLRETDSQQALKIN